MDLVYLTVVLGRWWQTWSIRRCCKLPWSVGQELNLVHGWFCLQHAGKDRGEAQFPNKQENAPARWCSHELGLHSSQVSFLEWEHVKCQQDFLDIPRRGTKGECWRCVGHGDREESKGCSIKKYLNLLPVFPLNSDCHSVSPNSREFPGPKCQHPKSVLQSTNS